MLWSIVICITSRIGIILNAVVLPILIYVPTAWIVVVVTGLAITSLVNYNMIPIFIDMHTLTFRYAKKSTAAICYMRHIINMSILSFLMYQGRTLSWRTLSRYRKAVKLLGVVNIKITLLKNCVSTTLHCYRQNISIIVSDKRLYVRIRSCWRRNIYTVFTINQTTTFDPNGWLRISRISSSIFLFLRLSIGYNSSTIRHIICREFSWSDISTDWYCFSDKSYVKKIIYSFPH